MGITQLFVLSTRTMQWFEERGTISFFLISSSVIFSFIYFRIYSPCLPPSIYPQSHSLNPDHSLTPFKSFNYPLSLPLSLPPPGFVLSDPSLLPSTRQYNKSRGSKVYIKVLRSQRDVDAEELLWNV